MTSTISRSSYQQEGLPDLSVSVYLYLTFPIIYPPITNGWKIIHLGIVISFAASTSEVLTVSAPGWLFSLELGCCLRFGLFDYVPTISCFAGSRALSAVKF